MHPDSAIDLLSRRFAFERLHEWADEAHAQGQSIFDLSLGCPAGRPPEHVVRAFTDSLRRPRPSAYRRSGVEGLLELRRAMSGWYDRRFMVHLDPRDEILPVSSSLEALHLVLSTFIKEGDTVLLPSPCPASWPSAVALAGGVPFYLPLREDGSLPLEKIGENELKTARVFILSYPHDPTGSICDLSMLRDSLALCRDHDILLVSDIRWSEFSLVEEHLSSSVLQLAGARESAVEISSPSCSHRLGGWGPGFLAGSASQISRLRIRAGHRGPGPFLAAQEATLAALTGDDAFLVQQRMRIQRHQQRFREGLSALGFSLPSSPATIFLWGKIPQPYGEDDERFTTELFRRSGVLLAPGSAFGPSGKGFVRVSLSLDDAALDACLSRLEETQAFKMI